MDNLGSVIAADLGGTRIKLGLVGDAGIRELRDMPSNAGAGMQACLSTLSRSITEILEAAKSCQPVAGIALAFPGLVNSRTAEILSTPADKFGGAPDVDLVAWADGAFGLPLVVENDANMALLGEWTFGAGRGVDDLVLVTLGTGVGTSALIEGRPLRGKHFQAGCLGGHFSLDPDGIACICGGRGCIEAHVGTWALPDLLRAHPDFAASAMASEELLDYEALFRHAHDGDLVAMAIRDRSIRYWGLTVANLIHAYDPERVLIGGGLMRSADAILPGIREQVAALAWTPWGEVDIRVAEHLDTAALLGGHVALHRSRNNRTIGKESETP